MNRGLYVKVLNRDDPSFKNRSWRIYSNDKVQVIPVQDDALNCDLCGRSIETENINILCQDGGTKIGEIEHGARCEKCLQNLYPDIPKHRPQKVEYWLLVNKEPLWIGPDLEELRRYKDEHIEGTPPSLMVLERPLCPRCTIVPNTDTNICPVCEQDVGETKEVTL